MSIRFSYSQNFIIPQKLRVADRSYVLSNYCGSLCPYVHDLRKKSKILPN